MFQISYEGGLSLLLRVFLFMGLVAHKLIWEVLKNRNDVPKPKQQGPASLAKRFVKLAKVAVLAFIAFQTLFLKLFRITAKPRPLHIIGMTLYLIGLATAIVGRLQLGKNWANLEDYQVGSEQSLVTNGIYHYIRHPIYAGDLLLLTGLELALNSWLVLGTPLLFAVILRQARMEEELLMRAFSGYGAYRKRTRLLFPFVL